MIKIIGHAKPLTRTTTGLHSFDRAFINADGDIGFPLGKLTEVYGPTHVGKSTVVYSLASLIIDPEADIGLADLEDFDPDFLTAILSYGGFSGKVYSILEDTDEKTLQELINVMWETCGVGILDAIGSIAAVSEKEGEFGEANMGKRAKLMGQFSRSVIYMLRSSEQDKNIFMVNHQHNPMGGFSKKPIAPGGNTKEYLSSMRIQIKRKYLNKKEQKFSDGSYIIDGKVVKNKWGLEGKEFSLFILAGKGIHFGLTALVDGVKLGEVSRGRTYKIGDKSFGSMKKMLEEAHAGNNEFFQPFYDALKENENS